MIYDEKVIDKNEKHYFNSEKIISEFLHNKKSEDVYTAKFKKRVEICLDMQSLQ